MKKISALFLFILLFTQSAYPKALSASEKLVEELIADLTVDNAESTILPGKEGNLYVFFERRAKDYKYKEGKVKISFEDKYLTFSSDINFVVMKDNDLLFVKREERMYAKAETSRNTEGVIAIAIDEVDLDYNNKQIKVTKGNKTLALNEFAYNKDNQEIKVFVDNKEIALEKL